MGFSTQIMAVIGLVLYLMYRYLGRVYTYWQSKNISGPRPVFILGNFLEVILRQKSFAEVITSVYKQYPQQRFVGIYQGRSPFLIVRHIDDIKQVLIKDFSNFRNRGLAINENPLSKNLFHAKDETWQLLRQRLTPIFTSGKLKSMFHLMDECICDFHKYLDVLVNERAEPEIRNLMAKFTLEVFGSCVLGINMSTINDDANVFRDIGIQIFKPSLKLAVCRTVDSIFPGIFRKVNVRLHNEEVVNFFMNLVRALIKERQGKPKIRKDFMDLMIELKEQGHIKGNKIDLEITDTLMAAQAVIFYAAGFETSSATTSFLLHELALNQNIQEKVYQEVQTVIDKHNGVMSYEAIQEMSYLDMVLQETLRKHSVAGVLIRESSGTYTFPGSKLTIDEGIKVVIPLSALQSDPQYFSDPDTFDPDRFSPENKHNIQQCTYMPFGDGPRNCIGIRFAKIQSMVGVASLIKKYKVVPSDKTVAQLQYDPRTSTLQSKDGIWMKIERR